MGAISLHDIKNYLNAPELAELVIAGDILREDIAVIHPTASLNEALDRFEQMQFDPGAIRANAERFSMERFHRELLEFVHDQYAEFERKRSSSVAVSNAEVSNTIGPA